MLFRSDLIPLAEAVLCEECRRISRSRNGRCAGCESQVLTNLGRLLHRDRAAERSVESGASAGYRLLRAARNEQGAAKIAGYGPQGSGKTTTLGMLALGLSITYHDRAPVAMHDTENGSDYLAPLFAIEGVPLVVHKSRAFADLLALLDEAEPAGC